MAKALDGKVAVVTGSTGAIGLGLARALAEAGADLMLNGLGDKAKIETSRAEVESRFGIKALYSSADMRDPRAIERMMRTAAAELGPVDILINNAGIQHVAPVETFDGSKWQDILAVNCSAAFYTAKAALPAMRERGWGRIINIAAAHGLFASPYKSAYVAANHALVGLTKVIGLETAEAEHITCNAICSGYVKTALVDSQISDQAKAYDMSEAEVLDDIILASQPTKRFVGIDEIAALMLHLCSDGARSFNGAALPLDGGWSAR